MGTQLLRDLICLLRFCFYCLLRTQLLKDTEVLSSPTCGQNLINYNLLLAQSQPEASWNDGSRVFKRVYTCLYVLDTCLYAFLRNLGPEILQFIMERAHVSCFPRVCRGNPERELYGADFLAEFSRSCPNGAYLVVLSSCLSVFFKSEPNGSWPPPEITKVYEVSRKLTGWGSKDT